MNKHDMYAPKKIVKTPCNICKVKGIDHVYLERNSARWLKNENKKIAVLSAEVLIDNYLTAIRNNHKMPTARMERAIDTLKELVEGDDALGSLRANRVLLNAINEWRQRHVTINVTIPESVVSRVRKIMETDGKEVIDAEFRGDAEEGAERPLLLSQ
jgi:hypothetical protein